MKDKIEYTDAEILEIAKGQKAIQWLIVVNLLTIWIPFASIVTGIIGAIFIYRLGKAERSSLAVLYTILAFVPLIGLIGLLIVNSKATVVLRQRGIRVGLMGAKKEDLLGINIKKDQEQAKKQEEILGSLPATFEDPEKLMKYFVEETRGSKSFEATLEEVARGFKSGKLQGDQIVRKTVDGDYQWTTVAELCKTFRDK